MRPVAALGVITLSMNSVSMLMNTEDVSPDACTNNRAASKQGLSRLDTREWHCVATLGLLQSAVSR